VELLFSAFIHAAVQAVKKGILLTTVMGASIGALSAIFSAQLSSIMSGDPAVIAYSQQKMVIISSTYFICGINEIFGCALRGMKRPNAAAVAALFFTCILRFIWVYLIFPLMPNLTFLYLVWPVGWILSILALICVYIPTVKQLTREAEPA
jgi:Na+-driven multidrug efflux pump